MKKKIKAYFLSLIISFMLMSLSFFLIAVDYESRGVAGYMGDSAITAFLDSTEQNETQKKLPETSENPTEAFFSIKKIIDFIRLITKS